MPETLDSVLAHVTQGWTLATTFLAGCDLWQQLGLGVGVPTLLYAIVRCVWDRVRGGARVAALVYRWTLSPTLRAVWNRVLSPPVAAVVGRIVGNHLPLRPDVCKVLASAGVMFTSRGEIDAAEPRDVSKDKNWRLDEEKNGCRSVRDRDLLLHPKKGLIIDGHEVSSILNRRERRLIRNTARSLYKPVAKTAADDRATSCQLYLEQAAKRL